MAKKIQLKDKLNVPLYPVTRNNITTGIEFATDEWIDGKQVFRKRINCGSLPNNTTKLVGIGIALSSITIIGLKGIANRADYNYPLPQSDPSGLNTVSLAITNPSNIEIKATSDRSTFTGYVDIYYTKN